METCFTFQWGKICCPEHSWRIPAMRKIMCMLEKGCYAYDLWTLF